MRVAPVEVTLRLLAESALALDLLAADRLPTDGDSLSSKNIRACLMFPTWVTSWHIRACSVAIVLVAERRLSHCGGAGGRHARPC